MIQVVDEFGIEGYRCQDTQLKEPYYKIPITKFGKNMKSNNFIDIAIKDRKWVPPANYNVMYDWASIGKTGKFLKGPRVLFTDQII